ncbi:MAG: hypothetical protein LUE64_05245 [Candidatus Gastranaerophilales bacterium]|nr:hypothetical protein [Candidatus Gastranaerophilales bacterium]
MKKFYIVFAALIVLFFCTGRLLAANSDFKNNLLKIELTKTDDTHYNIGLYTQKAYNEPVKIIKKTDTIYYFLLPETSHSITSVQPVGDIKNVLVKSYPYAGQDLDNAYTKVAIITSKPLNLTTSLKTADPSISPRLNPLRLAKLDQVFENYAQRLANNNVPTPLSEFGKPASTAKTDTQKTASASTQTKQTAEITAKTVSTPVSTTAKSSLKSTDTIASTSAASTKTQASTASKTTQAQNSASTAAKTQTATAASKDSAVKAAAKSNAVVSPAKVAASTSSTETASTRTQVPNTAEISSNSNKSNLLADNSNAAQKNSQVIEAAKKSAVTSSVPTAGSVQNIPLNSSSTKTQASTPSKTTQAQNSASTAVTTTPTAQAQNSAKSNAVKAAAKSNAVTNTAKTSTSAASKTSVAAQTQTSPAKTQASAITSSKTSTAKSVNEAVKNSAITSVKTTSASAKSSAKNTATTASTPSKTTQAQNSASTAVTTTPTAQAQNSAKSNAVKAAAKSNAVTNTAKTSTSAASKTSVAAQTQTSPAKTQASAITSSKTSTAKSVNEAVKNSAIIPSNTKQQNTKAIVSTVPKAVSPAATQIKPSETKKIEQASAVLNADNVQNAITAKSQEALNSADKLNTAEKQVIEYEKQLANKNPVNAEFAQKTTPSKEEMASSSNEVQEQNQKAIKQKNSKPAPNIPQKNNGNANLLVLSSLFLVMFYSYVKVKKANERKKNMQAEAIAAQNTKSEGVKDLLNKKKAKQPAQVLQNAVQAASAPLYSAPVEQNNILEETINEQVQEEAPVSKPETIRPALKYLDETDYTPISSDVINQYDMQEFEPLTRLRQEQMQKAREEYEKAQAFNAYMDSIAEKTEDKPVSIPSEVPQTEDDAVLQELYTPIEPDYTEEDVVARYNNEPAEPAEESATIVSSSKLTETRGLYLAQFEGATSLVGYIQDDVYVLYNFGELKTEDLDIQSRLAQENDTDSLYIVKTGGKKLMVKSTPYDMRLEMVM